MGDPIGILSDIHGNWEAFEAVLEHIDAQGVESMVFLGDLLGYGADPIACTREIMKRNVPCLLGNHDEAITRGPDSLVLPSFNRYAAAAVAWTREQLGIEAFLGEIGEYDEALFNFMNDLTPTFDYKDFEGLEDAIGSHASLIEPNVFHYIESIDPQTGEVDDKLTRKHAGMILDLMEKEHAGKRLLLTGHFHTPCFFWRNADGVHRVHLSSKGAEGVEVDFLIKADGSLEISRTPITPEERPPGQPWSLFRLDASEFEGAIILNPGSVGQPRDSIPDASCMIYLPDLRWFVNWRVPYDIEKAGQKIKEAQGLPDPLGERLKLGR